jgi:hypothetical protein
MTNDGFAKGKSGQIKGEGKTVPVLNYHAMKMYWWVEV